MRRVHGQPQRRSTSPTRAWIVLLPLLTGCAAFRNDLDGIDARFLPDEFRVAPVNGMRPIDPALLGQNPPPEYLVDSGDVLAVYVEGVLGDEANEPPQSQATTRFARPTTGFPIAVRDDGTIALPYSGPVNVRGLSLRGVEQRLREHYTRVNPLLRDDTAKVLVALHQPRTYRVLVVRQESGNRQGNIGSGGTVNFEIDKRGTGRVVELPAYRNDVLNALSETGGLPGVDARNVVYVVRRPRCRVALPHRSASPDVWSPGRPTDGPGTRVERQPTVSWQPLVPQTAEKSPYVFRGQSPPPGPVPVWPQRESTGTISSFEPNRWHPSVRNGTPDVRQPSRSATVPLHVAPSLRPFAVPTDELVEEFEGSAVGVVPEDPFAVESCAVSYRLDDATVDSSRVLEIPLRLHPGQPANFRPEDVVLYDGDVVFIESRQTEFFYTGGLLGGGQYPIPRDFDLNVIEALAVVERDGSGRNLLDRQVSGPAATGLDVTASASRLVILRTLPDGRQVNVEVNLYRAMEDPSARILIAPGDYLFLKYTRCEAVGAWVERWLFDNVANGVNNSRIVTGNRN